jgi:hypothetical protein
VPPLRLRDIAVGRGERSLLVGGTRAGKSTLGDHQVRTFADSWASARVLILDSKPRYRAETTPLGTSAQRHYRKWGHGPVIPGSVRVDIHADNPFRRGIFTSERRIAIAQVDTDAKADLGALLHCARKFFNQSRAGRAQMVYADEFMDYFHSNGSPVDNDDIMLRIIRSGGERDVASLNATQRSRGIPMQAIEEIDSLALFKVNYRKDFTHLAEHGIPDTLAIPTVKHEFTYWRRDDVPGRGRRLTIPPEGLRLRLEVPRTYLDELGRT